MFHFVALPAHSFITELCTDECGKKRANLRLAEWPV